MASVDKQDHVKREKAGLWALRPARSACKPLSLLFPLVITFGGFQSTCMAADIGSRPLQMQQQPPAFGTRPAIPIQKMCPDLNVSLTVARNANGSVALNGVVTNVGNADFATPSEAQYFMNLSYPPKTYAQMGVSDQLCTKAFKELKKGASFPINCTFNIPDFRSWAGAAAPGDAKRLFTLRAVKSNMSPYAPNEDCHPNNNSARVEVEYMKK